MLPNCVASIALAFAVLLLPARSLAAEFGPQGIVRQFCQADGMGQRVTIPGWAGLAPLVGWAYEPAWDNVTLITGYTVGSPQAAAQNSFTVEVRYGVIGQLSPLGLNGEAHAETVTYRVQADEQGSWLIVGPPPAPHVFANRVDIEVMRRSLSDGGVNFLANTVFVWQMFRSAGWDIPFESTADLLSGTTYRVVEDPKPGDLVVYLRDEAPYHVGLLEAKNQVVSSTFNAGITRTPIDAFAGTVRYLRLVRPGTVETGAETEAAPANTPALRPTPSAPKSTATPSSPKKRPTPTATAAKKKVTAGKKKGQPGRPAKGQHAMKPAARKRAKPKPQGALKRPKPTPAAPKTSASPAHASHRIA